MGAEAYVGRQRVIMDAWQDQVFSRAASTAFITFAGRIAGHGGPKNDQFRCRSP
jgi:hypothetical protein